MKKEIIISLIAVLVLLSGCEDKGETTIKTDEGDVEVETSGLDTGDWCPEGGSWKYAANVEGADSSGEWKVIGLENSGKYAGLCHVTYNVDAGSQGQIEMEYWFTEDGESGYVEMDFNGQKITQEWSK